MTTPSASPQNPRPKTTATAPSAAKAWLSPRWTGPQRNLYLALAFTLALVLWMLSGALSRPASTPDTTTGVRLPTVEVTASRAQTTPYTLTLTGRTSADTTANVVAEVDGRVVARLVNEGKIVRRGDVLLRLDVGTKDAELQRAKAAFQAAETIHHTTEKLFKQGFRAETDYIRSQADLAAAEANLRTAQRRLSDTVVRSPIDGAVEEVLLDVGDFAQPQQEVVRVVGLGQFLITANVAQQERGLLQVGQPVTATLASGETVQGTLRFVGVEADAQTKTFPVEVLVKHQDKKPLPVGMTAQVTLPAGEVQAHQLDHNAVVLDDTGVMGVMTWQASPSAAEQNQGRAVFMPVKILQDGPTGLTVTGLPADITIITRGQAGVKTGAMVQVMAPATTPAPATTTPQEQPR